MNRRSVDRVWQQHRLALAARPRWPLHIRPYQRRDRGRIREIICATALRGRPVTAFFEDDEVLLKLFMDYYVTHEPESCFVAESEGRVVGYIMGCKDTRRYLRVVLFRYGPRLLARLLLRLLTGRYRRLATYRTLWWALVRAWREVPEADLRDYPAHAHIGIDQELRAGGFTFYVCMVRLGDALIRHLRAAGVRGLHGQIAEPGDQDLITGRIQALYGFQVAAMRKFSLWRRLTGEAWYLKLMTVSLDGDRSRWRV